MPKFYHDSIDNACEKVNHLSKESIYFTKYDTNTCNERKHMLNYKIIRKQLERGEVYVHFQLSNHYYY